MIARPVSSALGCGSCRHAILKAVVSRSAPGLHLPEQRVARQTQQQQQQHHRPAGRGLSTSSALRTGQKEEAVQRESLPPSKPQAEPGSSAEVEDDYEDTPWFLQEEPPRHPPIQHAVDLPRVPEDAPYLLEPMMKYIYEDMGLDDLSLLDLRDLDPPAALGPNLMMLFGTARSERHLHVCSNRFVRWLKKNHRVNARADGLIGPGELRTKLRRLRKKAKLLGTNASILPGGDTGISTGWVCVNFAAADERGADGETASFDESGRLSGFGAPQTGTTVVVQVMTEARRNELDLEALWQSLLRRNLEEMERIKAGGSKAVVDARKVDGLVAARIQLPRTSSSAQQWEALKRASQQQQQQQRLFSTSARWPAQAQAQGAHTAPANAEAGVTVKNADQLPDLATLKRQIDEVQLTGTAVTQEALLGFITAALRAPSPLTSSSSSSSSSSSFSSSNQQDHQDKTLESFYKSASALERLALVDRICRIADERGMSVISTEWLVAIIEAITTSPAYGPELIRSQHSIELLLAEVPFCLSPSHVLRLMVAHAARQDWDRFWDAFRTPPRFQVPRGPELYELAFRTMAATRDRRMCIDALRWVYPEMTREQVPVWPVGALYESLRACIHVADPAAEQLMRNPPNTDVMGTMDQMRLKNREFLRVLREVEAMRSHRAAVVAQEQSAQTISQLRKPDSGSPGEPSHV